VRRVTLALVVALLLAPAVAGASQRHPTQGELEGEVMCPVCGTTLDQSNSPAAEQIKRVIAKRIAAGDTKSEIKNRLVAEYGDAILAAPPRHGFGLVAWWLPIAGIVLAAGLVGVGAWRWSRAREPPPRDVQLDPALERRLDDELRRFES
jgi:cytochrome c-type biogenesis protein CcmH